jgi:hypothetical protein
MTPPPLERRYRKRLSICPATARIEDQQMRGWISIYEALAPGAGFAFCFTAANRVFAAGPEECGFCPVIKRPSLTT